METAEIKAYHEIYRKELFDYVVPFWLSHSPGPRIRGYPDCCWSADGIGV